MAEEQPGNGRLDSWKAIAAYLRRDVRTAIRWEKERDLPIHRIPGGQRQAVFAFVSEINDWLMQQSKEEQGEPDSNESNDLGTIQTVSPPADGPDTTRRQLERWTDQGAVANSVGGADADTAVRVLDEEPVPEGELSLDSELVHRNARISRWGYIWTGICIAGTAIALALYLLHPTTPVIRPNRIAKLTDDGRYKSNLRTDGRFLYFDETEGNRQVLAAVSIDGGSIRRIPTQFSNVDLQDVSSNDEYLLGLVPMGIERERPLWYIPLQGGTSGRVGEFTCNSARIAPTKNIIACATGTSISLWDPETNIFRTIGAFGSAVTGLEWSRDSERLRFSLQDGISSVLSPWELTLPNDKATHILPRRLSLGENCCSSWTWLNGYSDFAYLRQEDKGRQRLFIRRENSGIISWARSEHELLVEIGTVELLAPASSPNKLYVLIESSIRSQLLKYHKEQHAFQTLFPGLSGGYFAFSRDGKWMTYLDSNQKLWRSRIDGTEALQLTKEMEYAQLSSWSPDGRKIAFMGANPGKPWRIFIVDRDGGEPKEAGRGEDAQGAPTWSPDGSKIAYGNVLCSESQSCWIRIIDLATGHEDKLPGSHDLRTARWSPDGKYIAALSPDTHQLMLFDVAKSHWRVLAENVTGDTINWAQDSKEVYADSPQGERPVIESFRISDGKRKLVVGLSELEKVPGRMEFWFGLTPDGSPILVHLFTASEIYSIEWAGT